jgi:beta-glucanase (GH16 family)
MIGKHILTIIAFLFIIFLVLIYIFSSGDNSITGSNNTFSSDADNTAVSIPVDSHSVVSGSLPTNENPTMTPDAGFSNMVPEAELEEKARSGWELIWNDEFNGSIINEEYWTLQTGEDIWGNNELQYYTDRTDNCYIKNGNLIIRGLREKYGNSDYTSARIVTKDKLSFLYGKIEIKAKLPEGVGLLSAFWFLPCQEIYNYRLKNGEFEMVEMLGNDPESIFAVAHYSFNKKTKSYEEYSDGTDYSRDFHVYSIEWDPQKIKWLVDDKVYFTFDFDSTFDENYDPFNKPFYLIINLAIGGDWPGDDLSKTVFPSLLEIDYVRYYEKCNR